MLLLANVSSVYLGPGPVLATGVPVRENSRPGTTQEKTARTLSSSMQVRADAFTSIRAERLQDCMKHSGVATMLKSAISPQEGMMYPGVDRVPTSGWSTQGYTEFSGVS